MSLESWNLHLMNQRSEHRTCCMLFQGLAHMSMDAFWLGTSSERTLTRSWKSKNDLHAWGCSIKVHAIFKKAFNLCASNLCQITARDNPSASPLWEGKLLHPSDKTVWKKTPSLPPTPVLLLGYKESLFFKKEKRCCNKQASRVPVKNMIFSTLRGNST